MDPDKVVDAVLKVSRAYLPERIVYMVGAGGGVLLLLYLVLAKGEGYDPAGAVAIFGSGGLFATTAYGVLRAFDKTLNTIQHILGAMSNGRPGEDGQG